MCSSSGSGGKGPELHALADGELLAEVAGLVAERNRVEARLTAAVRVADTRLACGHDGVTTMQSWLRTHCGMRSPAAAALVQRGRVVELLPATAAAFAAGAIGAEHVTAIAPITAPRELAAAAE
jgi:hypothetical protein